MPRCDVVMTSHERTRSLALRNLLSPRALLDKSCEHHNVEANNAPLLNRTQYKFDVIAIRQHLATLCSPRPSSKPSRHRRTRRLSLPRANFTEVLRPCKLWAPQLPSLHGDLRALIQLIGEERLTKRRVGVNLYGE